MNTEIADIDAQIAMHQSQIKKLLEQKAKASERLKLDLYEIVATPSRSDHITHTVAYFTTFEMAQTAIGHPNGSAHSYDPDDKCGWNYIIVKRSRDKVEPYWLTQLNALPSHFPYNGD